MKKITILAVALAVLALPASAAQLYRWVDEKGRVEWRDTPPPPNARKVEQRNLGTNTIQTSGLPYSVQQAVKNFPVVLWTTSCGEICDKARAHLSRRGVPHTEKNPQSEMESFKKISGGSMEVPLMLVGRNQYKGYLESEWDAALDAAGYPRTPAVPLKPQPKSPPSTQAPAPDSPLVRLYTNPQCGPQCDEARQLLASRGIKFQDVVVEGPAAIEELRKLSGDTAVPTLHAGRFIVPGFDAAGYHRVLDESGLRRDQQAAQ
jgi:glutaredoxin